MATRDVHHEQRNAYVGRPLIIEARSETDVPSWWIKGPVTFADRITLRDTATAWTPIPTFGGASVGITLSTQTGFYVYIGNMCYVECHLVFTSKGSSTGQALIAGAPFVAASSQSGLFTVTSIANVNSLTVAPLIRISSGSFTLDTAALGGSNLTDANFTNNTNLSFCGWFRST